VGNRGRSSDPNDTIRLLKSKLRSLEREVHRLRKINGRATDRTDGTTDDEEKEGPAKHQKKAEPNISCDKCGHGNVSVMELTVRGELRTYGTCCKCKFRKRYTKK